MAYTDHTYQINADHRVAEYTFRNTTVRVRAYEDGHAFATHPKLGCGKDQPSEWEAIVHLFEDHGCFNVEVFDPLA